MKSCFSAFRSGQVLIAASLLVAATLSGLAQEEVITYAGLAGNTGTQNGEGAAARFTRPVGIAADVLGNVYVVDTSDQVVRKIDPYGNVSTLAGSPGISGSADGTGTSARFSYPWGAAVDEDGNVYVCDSGNHTIRKITPAGVVTTVAGSPGVPGSSDGTGSAAQFNHPSSIAVGSSGSLFVTDYSNSTIRKITSMGVVTTIAGVAGEFSYQDGKGSAARLNYPDGIALDNAGNIYVSDTNNHVIRRITPAGDVTTVAGTPMQAGSVDGSVTAARFDHPIGIAVARTGELFVADSLNNTIRRIANGAVTTIAGSPGASGSDDGTGTAARFLNPIGLAVDLAGTIFVTDTYNGTVRRAYTPGNRSGATLNVDAHPDLIWRRAGGGRTDVWTFKGTHFEQATTLGSMSGAWHLAGAGRFNDDNVSDLLWQNRETGEVGFWFVNDLTPSYQPLGTWGTGWWVVAAGDFNNDGWSDIVWQNVANGEAVAWLMQGTSLLSTLSLGNPGADWRIVATGDLNGDGQTDLLLENTTTGVAEVEYLNAGTPAGTAALPAMGADWHIFGAGDFNADGYTDVAWHNTSTGARLVEMMENNQSYFTLILPNDLPAPRADFDSDGKSDIVWRFNPTGDLIIWFMDGTTIRSNTSLGTSGLNWRVPATGDFNGDGQADLIWYHTPTGANVLWLMDGLSNWTSVELENRGPDWQVAGTGDFNGDGKTDIVWINNSLGTAEIRFMDGGTVLGSQSLGSFGPNWTIATVGDLNGDRSADIVWHQLSTGEYGVWLMNGATSTSYTPIGTRGSEWHSNGTGDFNGDGKDDILWWNTATQERTIWFMDGTTVTSEFSLGTSGPNWEICN